MSDGTNLEAAFARLEGVVTTEMKHLAHDVKNLTQKLEGYPTRRELEAAESRISLLETTQRKVAWAIITAWISGLGTVGALIAKKL